MGAVHHEAALRLTAHQARLGELFQVKAQRRGTQAEPIGQGPRGQSLVAGHHQRPEGAQPLHLGQRGERGQGLGFGVQGLVHRFNDS